MPLLKIRGPVTRARDVPAGQPRTPVSDCIRRRWKSSVPAGAAPLVIANDRDGQPLRFSISDQL